MKGKTVKSATEMKKIIIATRGSALALKQAQEVKAALEENGVLSEIKIISTKGDKDRKTPLNKIGGNGLFVREIEMAVLEGEADIAVHSAKDLPYELNGKLTISGTLKAASCNDCLILRHDESVKENFVIATGSIRRRVQAKKLYPNAVFCDIRGNVDSRLKRLENREFDALILAKAGLDRLQVDLSKYNALVLDEKKFIPAVCQGIIAIECRKDDENLCRLLSVVTDKNTYKRFSAERYMFSLLKADCSKAVGIYCKINDEEIDLTVMLDGKTVERCGLYEDYKAVCENIRDEILN